MSFALSAVCMQCILEHMEPKAQHLWLGKESISKMHFDAVDNFFAQVVGCKRFILIEPKQTNRMVDGRLHKAYYSYDHQNGTFERDQATGVVHRLSCLNEGLRTRAGFRLPRSCSPTISRLTSTILIGASALFSTTYLNTKQSSRQETYSTSHMDGGMK